MKWLLAFAVMQAAAAQAEPCASPDDRHFGINVTQQGGVVYQIEPAPMADGTLMVASLLTGPMADRTRQDIDYQNGFHVRRANDAVARILLPEVTGAMAKGSDMSVVLDAPAGVHPVAGQVWTGTLMARLTAQDAVTN